MSETPSAVVEAPPEGNIYEEQRRREGRLATLLHGDGSVERIKVLPRTGPNGDVDPDTGTVVYDAVSLDDNRLMFGLSPGSVRFDNPDAPLTNGTSIETPATETAAVPVEPIAAVEGPPLAHDSNPYNSLVGTLGQEDADAIYAAMTSGHPGNSAPVTSAVDNPLVAPRILSHAETMDLAASINGASPQEAAPQPVDYDYYEKLNTIAPHGTRIFVERDDRSIEANWFVASYHPEAGKVSVRNESNTVEKDIPVAKFLELNPDIAAALNSPDTDSPVSDATSETPPADAAAESAPEPKPGNPDQPTGKYTAESTQMPDDMPEEDKKAVWERIRQEAKQYFEIFNNSQELDQETTIDGIIKLRELLATKVQAVKDDMEAGLAGISATEGLSQEVIDSEIQAAVQEAIETESQRLVEIAVVQPNDDRRRTIKETRQKRQRITELITMDQTAFDKLIEDWKLYNREQSQQEALEEFGGVKGSVERKDARQKKDKLRELYGSSIDSVADMPIDTKEGGQADKIIKDYAKDISVAAGLKNVEASKGLLRIKLAGSMLQMQDHLRSQYQTKVDNQGNRLFDDDTIEQMITDKEADLKSWLQAAGHSGAVAKPLEDLRTYSDERRREELWGGQRQKARRHLVNILIPRVVSAQFGEQETAKDTPIDMAEVLARSIDPSGLGAKAGADALRSSARAESYRGRVMLQLEMAREVSRHQSTLLRGSILLAAGSVGLMSETAMSAWEAVSEETKKRELKKRMLGMYTAAKSIRALRLRRQKARPKATEQREDIHYG